MPPAMSTWQSASRSNMAWWPWPLFAPLLRRGHADRTQAHLRPPRVVVIMVVVMAVRRLAARFAGHDLAVIVHGQHQELRRLAEVAADGIVVVGWKSNFHRHKFLSPYIHYP